MSQQTTVKIAEVLGQMNGVINSMEEQGLFEEANALNKVFHKIACDNCQCGTEESTNMTQQFSNEMSNQDEPDFEVEMAHNQLSTAKRAIQQLQETLGVHEKNLPAWVQSKLTTAVDYLDTISDYMKSDKDGVEMEDNEAVPMKAKSFNMTVDSPKTSAPAFKITVE